MLVCPVHLTQCSTLHNAVSHCRVLAVTEHVCGAHAVHAVYMLVFAVSPCGSWRFKGDPQIQLLLLLRDNLKWYTWIACVWPASQVALGLPMSQNDLGSLMRSHAKIAGSSLYILLVMVLTRLAIAFWWFLYRVMTAGLE